MAFGGKVPRKRKSKPTVPPEVSEARMRRLIEVPKHHKSLFAAAWAGRSRKLAIKAQCIECMGFQRSLIKGCTSLACSLYPYRPFQDEPDEPAAQVGQPAE